MYDFSSMAEEWERKARGYFARGLNQTADVCRKLALRFYWLAYEAEKKVTHFIRNGISRTYHGAFSALQMAA